MRDDELIRLVNDCVTNDIGTAIRVVHQLQEWIENTANLSHIPHAWFTYTPYTLEVGIGPLTLWDDPNGYCDEHDEDNLSFQGCMGAFLYEIGNLLPFIGEHVE